MAGRCGCKGGCSCCMVESSSIGISGSGSAGQCFLPYAKLSSEPGNRLRSDADGLWSGPCASLPDGSPAETDEFGCLVIPPTVVLDYEGNPIPPNGAGEIPLPAGGLPPPYACGLETDGEGVLSVKTSGVWPGEDLLGQSFEGAYTQGSEIYCGPDGALRGAPQGTAITAGAASQVLAPTIDPFDAATNTPGGAAVSMTNPSLARSMLIHRVMTATVDCSIPANGAAEIRLQERVDSGAWATVRSFSPPEPSTGSIRAALPITWARSTVVAPGGGHTLELRVQAEKTGAGGTDPSLIEVNVACRLMGVSQ